MFRVPCTELTTIYNFRSRKNVVEPRYNEGQRNKQNKRSLCRGFVVSRIVFIILKKHTSCHTLHSCNIIIQIFKRLKFYLHCLPSSTSALVKFNSRRLDFAEKDTHEPSNTLHEKLDVHKFTRCKYGAKECKLRGNEKQRW